MQAVFDNPNKIIDRAYTKSLQKNLKKSLDEVTKERAFRQSFFHELANHAEQRPVPKIVNLKTKSNQLIPNLFTAVSDIHINSRVEGLRDTSPYNNQICLNSLKEVAYATNEKRAKCNTVLINGDISESVTGKNHADVWTEMEYGKAYASGIFEARNILAYFLRWTKIVI